MSYIMDPDAGSKMDWYEGQEHGLNRRNLNTASPSLLSRSPEPDKPESTWIQGLSHGRAWRVDSS